MIINENLKSYILALEPDGPLWLEDLRVYAEAGNVPIIRREMEPFLKVLLQMKRPERILEIGTGIGYSALFMDSCLEEPEIVTIENYEPRLTDARKNLQDKPRITLLEGDAAEWIPKLSQPFDFVFLDGPKGQYLSMLPDLLRLMKQGSVLLADNVLQEGELIRSRYAVARRQRTIHSRMREFVWEVKHHPDLESALIPIGDGVVLCIRR